MRRVKQCLKRLVYRQKMLRKFSVGYCAHNNLLPEILVKTPSEHLREILGLPAGQNSSQLNQDVFALIYNRFSPGFFIEIGANDGFELSNTAYLEECFGWTGILIEANPAYLDVLKKRKSIIVNKAVARQESQVEFVDAGLYGGISSTMDPGHDAQTSAAKKIRVPATTLDGILKECNAPSFVDFISIDVEGGELAIVEAMCALTEYRFRAGCIEHNFRTRDYEAYNSLLNASGYEVVWPHQTGHDLFFLDRTDAA